MGLQFIGLGDRQKAFEIWREGELEAREARNDAYIKEKTRLAELGEQPPEVIMAGYEDPDKPYQFSWDFSPGWRDRAMKRIRNLRAQGKVLMPRQIVVHHTHEEKIFESEVELGVFANGDACIRCHNFQPETLEERARLHKRLTDFTGYRRPDGFGPQECCCYCGARLDTQKGEAA